jgi:hypothetical protein
MATTPAVPTSAGRTASKSRAYTSSCTLTSASAGTTLATVAAVTTGSEKYQIVGNGWLAI